MLLLGVSNMVHDSAVTVWAGRGGSEKQGKMWPLLNILLWGFVTFIQMLHVWDKHTFNYEFSFWPLEVLEDNTRPPTSTSSRDQSSYIFPHQCLISAAHKSPWRKLTFCFRFSSCKAGTCCSCWESGGRGICLELRGDKLLLNSLKFWQITDCKWFPLKCGWMMPDLPFHMLLFPFPCVILAKQRKCPNPMTLQFSLEHKWLLDTLCLLLRGDKNKVAPA